MAFQYIKKGLTLVFILLITNIALSQTISAPKSGSIGSWRILGSVIANHTADHDQIIVVGPYDYFRHLKFKVTNSPLSLQRMVVRYDDGGAPESIEVRYDIPKGGESREIDLKGGRRKIKAVDFWYNTRGIINGRAELTLFGIK